MTTDLCDLLFASLVLLTRLRDDELDAVEEGDVVQVFALMGGKLTSVNVRTAGFLVDRLGAIEYFELSSSVSGTHRLLRGVERAIVTMFEPASELFVLLG